MASLLADTSSASLAPWPIIPVAEFPLSTSEGDACKRLALEMLREDPRLADVTAFGEGVSAGWAPGGNVIYEDHRAIELMPEDRLGDYEYRALALAGDGDFFLRSRKCDPAFEAYLRDIVGLGAPTVLRVLRDPAIPALGKAARDDQAILQKLADNAKSVGGMNVLPYLSTGYAWLLAGAIAAEARVPVHVIGPPPRLARCVNNKLWFAKCVQRLLGHQALPSTFAAYGPAAAAARLKRLADECDQVVVKLPASASAHGNLSLTASSVRRWPLEVLRRHLVTALHQRGWHDRYPILIGVWEKPALASPSTQIWIPRPENGPPVIEGFFVQSLEGDTGSFAGAVGIDVTELPEYLGPQAMQIATVFQKLGYFGRLSLDALLIGTDIRSADVEWIECNGRWGGVSIPLTVANRIGANALSLATTQTLSADTSVVSFEQTLERLNRYLFRSGIQQDGIVFLQPFGRGTRRIDFFSVAESRQDASLTLSSACAEIDIDVSAANELRTGTQTGSRMVR